MTWFVRLKEDAEVYKPRECPDYTDCDDFSIKLIHGGLMNEDPNYVGGSVDYVDFCNVDQISLLEIYAMLKECGYRSGHMKLWCKSPGTTMDRGLSELDTDDDVMLMCSLLPKAKYVEIYSVIVEPLSQVTEPVNLEDCNIIDGEQGNMREKSGGQGRSIYSDFPFDFCQSTQMDEEEIDKIRELEGLEEDEVNDIFGYDGAVEDESDEGQYDEGGYQSDSSYGESFHSDESNKDHSDDDLLFEINVDHSVKDNLDKDMDEVEMGDGEDDKSSVYAGSDEERMACNSTDEEEDSFPVFNEEVDMENPVFELGMCFKSSKIFRQAVKKHAIKERRPIVNVKHYGRKVKYICQDPCQWRIYASPMQNSQTYQIKTFVKKHTCMPTFVQKQINSTWIAEYYESDIRMNPTWPVSSFHQKIVNDLKCKVSKYAAYRAKNKALIKIRGTHEQQYEQVWKYATALKKTLPESTIKILTEDPEPGDERGRFLRMYICLGPLKKAFIHHCRHIVGLDGCHLKGPYGGILLAAIGVDANDGMYPIAWAIVEAETTESWCWFLQFLAQDLQIANDFDWTFLSDKQKGLVNALEAVVPNAEHRFCVMHLYQNMHKDYKGIALRQLLWKAARSSTDWEFNKHMNKLKEVSKNCYDWLMDKPKQQWSRSGFKINSSSDMFVNNHCEVFNSSIRQFRDLPIITMFREIHKAVMKRIQVRRDKMLNMDLIICPSAQKKLNKALQFAGSCVVTWSGGSSYSVICTDGGHELVVDLSKKTCSCRKWDLTGIPCYHACACIAMKAEPWDIHISNWYKKDMYIKLYSHTLEPVVGPEFWDDTPEPMPLPPNIKIPTGRPKKKRSVRNDIPADPTKLSRAGGKLRCSHCKATTHNARTCQSKKSDAVAKAIAEGKDPIEAAARKPVKCKKCGGEGHNSRTCSAKKNNQVASYQANADSNNQANADSNNQANSIENSKSPPRMKRRATKGVQIVSNVARNINTEAGGSKTREGGHDNLQWKGKPVTTLRQMRAAKNAK